MICICQTAKYTCVQCNIKFGHFLTHQDQVMVVNTVELYDTPSSTTHCWLLLLNYLGHVCSHYLILIFLKFVVTSYVVSSITSGLATPLP